MSSRNVRLKLSPEAQRDFIGILRYTGKTWGRDQVLVYRDKLNDALQMIGQDPRIGHRSNDLPPTHRLYYVGSHVIVYQISQPSVAVVRILHKRMSLAGHL
jgi:toxin ParE1/3/4